MKKVPSTKTQALPIILAVGGVLIITAVFYSAFLKPAKEPSLENAFNQTLSKKEQQAENAKIEKMLGWKKG